MDSLFKQFRRILFVTCLIFYASGVIAQQKIARSNKQQFKNFAREATEANVVFSMPEGFKEITDKSEASPFDYGITLPEQEFEIWFKVFPQKESAADSLYLEMGKNEAKTLAGENDYLVRSLPDDVLDDYNADAGKSYFINLPDSPVTRHYKYALLIILEKDNKGIIMATGLTNDKGPDFFKNLNRARNCIRFKTPVP